MSVGELFYGGPETSALLSDRNHLVFDWELVRAPWSAREYRELLDRREAIFGDIWPTVVLSNHDQSRHATRLAASAGIEDTDAVARAAAVILFTLRGTPFLYYGEEVGLRDVEVPFDEIIDPPARRIEEGWVWWNRDACRSPMPWDGKPGHGFTTGRPWIRFGEDAAARNVAAQVPDPGSVLATYRRSIALRQRRESLRRGSFRRLDLPGADVLAYLRVAGAEVTLVVANFAQAATTVDLGGAGDGPWRPIGGSHVDPHAPDATGMLGLRGLEVAILAHG
jgi:alpha-glucosidase